MGCGSSASRQETSSSVQPPTTQSGFSEEESMRRIQEEIKNQVEEAKKQLEREMRQIQNEAESKQVEAKQMLERMKSELEDARKEIYYLKNSTDITHRDLEKDTETKVRDTAQDTEDIHFIDPSNSTFKTASGASFCNASRFEKVKVDRVVRIFLSSTFRDMQRERDTFFLYGEPRLREWAKKKGLVLDFIDLRWGLTTEVSPNGEGCFPSKVTIRCYELIEQCPYFVCTLGSRYGWIPDHSKSSEWHADTDKRYPFLKEYGDLSVTHYEIKYGALKKNPVARRALFYERDEAYVLANTPDLTENERILYQAVNEKDRMNQDAMKQEIRQQFEVKIYQSARELTELMVYDLLAVFEVDFGNIKPVSENEDQAHEQLMRHRLCVFEGRTEILDHLTKNVKDQLENDATKIAVIGAESGVGKSSVIAALVRDLQRDSRLLVISHFVGCSNLSQYVESMNLRIYRLLFEQKVFADLPDSEQGKEMIKKGLCEILKQACAKSRIPIVLLVDAVDQLVDSQDYPQVHQLNWLPKTLSKNAALVVSTIDTHTSCKAANKAGLEIVPLCRLSANEIIQTAESYMKKSDKTLSQDQKQLILQNQKDTGHPLYLRIILDEMRVFGAFETMNKELQDLLSSDGVLELYDFVMSRWERQYNTILFSAQSPMVFEIVRIVISVLRISRIGLDDNELDDYVAYLLGRRLAGEEISIWKSFFFKLVDSLFIRNGRYTYFHQLLEQAVQKRYFSNPDIKVNEKRMYGLWLLGRYDSNNPDTAFVAEACHALCFGKEYAKLEQLLANEQVVSMMLDGRYKYEFYSCWKILNENGLDHKQTYQEIIKTFTDAGSKLIRYFQDARESDFLIPIIQARISGRTSEDEKVDDYFWLGRVLNDKGQYDQALEYYHKSLAIKIKTLGEEHLDVAESYNNIASVYDSQGEYEQALEYYNKALVMRIGILSEEHPDVATLYSHIGSLYRSQALFEQSMECQQKALTIRIKILGEEHPDVAASYNNIANVDYNQGMVEEALENYRKALAIYMNALGEEHADVASSYNGIANIYNHQGKFDEALDYYQRSLVIKIKTLGEGDPDVATSYNNIAIVYNSQGKFEQALDFFHKDLDISLEALGEDHPNVANTYYNMAGLFENQGKVPQALEYYTKAKNILHVRFGSDHPHTILAQERIQELNSQMDCEEAGGDQVIEKEDAGHEWSTGDDDEFNH